MTSLLRRGAAAAIFSAVAFVPSLASAFCRTTTVPVPPSYSPTRGCFTEGLPLFWKNQCVSYSMNNAASARVTLEQASTTMGEAFQTWISQSCNGTPVGIQISATNPVECSEVRYNQNGPNQNVIVFRDANWPYSDPNNTLGLTTVTFNADTGEIYDADMEINASGKNLSVGDPVPANGFDLLSVVTHEAGHFLGLAHATSATSTMFASYKPGTTTLRSLTADDVAGLCAIYPNAEDRVVDKSVPGANNGLLAADKCDPAPRHGFGTGCAENATSNEKGGCSVTRAAGRGAGSVLGFGLAAIGVVVIRRRRRI